MSSLSHTAYYRDDATILSRLTLIPEFRSPALCWILILTTHPLPCLDTLFFEVKIERAEAIAWLTSESGRWARSRAQVRGLDGCLLQYTGRPSPLHLGCHWPAWSS